METVDNIPYAPEPPAFRRPKENVLFFHIPKTAGTSVSHFFRKRFSRNTFVGGNFNRVKSFWPNTGVYYGAHIDWNQFNNFPLKTRSFTYLRDPAKQIESVYYFVRGSHHEAESLSDSARMTRTHSFKDWLKYLCDGGPANEGQINGNDNMYFRCLLGRPKTRDFARLPHTLDSPELALAKSRLEKFDAVGLVEDFNRSLVTICKACGVAPPSREEIQVRNRTADRSGNERQPIDDEMAQMLDSLTQLDREIYAHGKMLYERQMLIEGTAPLPQAIAAE